MKTLKKITKILLYFFIVVINIALFARIYLYGYYPAEMKNFAWNEVAAQSATKGTLEIYKIKPAAERDSAKTSRFFCNHLYILPSAGQVQITLKTNNSMPKLIAEDLKLETTPEYEDLSFYFVLVDQNDNEYPLTEKKHTSATIYQYEKLIFNSIPFKNITALYLDIYYEKEGEEREQPYTRIYIYDSRIPLKEYKLSEKERK